MLGISGKGGIVSMLSLRCTLRELFLGRGGRSGGFCVISKFTFDGLYDNMPKDIP